MASRSLFRSVARDRAVLLLILGLIAVSAWYLLRSRTPRHVHLRLSAGRPQGPRYAMAQTLAVEAKARGIAITLVSTAGSEDALDRLNAGQIDVAMIQGGLAIGTRTKVRLVSPLHVEALHLLVKKELRDEAAKSLDALRGKTVNLGELGSGTRVLATAVMRFAHLEPGTDFQDKALSYDAVESAVVAGHPLPDAIFMVSLLPSGVAETLVAKRGYRLVALPFSEAFTLGGLARNTVAETSVREGLRREEVVETVIPPFTYGYGVRPGVPSEATVTLGTRMLLVARKDVDPEAVSKLLEATFTTAFAHLAHPPLTLKLMDLPPPVTPHTGMALFQERSKPLITSDLIDAFEKETSIAGALIGGSFFLWQWLKRRYRRQRESGFEDYILRVADVERRSLALELAEALDLAGLLSLQNELGRIKGEAITKFAQGELEGEDLMSGFLAQASDARDHLTRLILHRRDDLERQAREQKREAVALWREALNNPRPSVRSKEITLEVDGSSPEPSLPG